MIILCNCFSVTQVGTGDLNQNTTPRQKLAIVGRNSKSGTVVAVVVKFVRLFREKCDDSLANIDNCTVLLQKVNAENEVPRAVLQDNAAGEECGPVNLKANCAHTIWCNKIATGSSKVHARPRGNRFFQESRQLSTSME